MVKTATAGFLIFLTIGLPADLCIGAKLFQGRREGAFADLSEKRYRQEQTRLFEDKAVWILRNIIAQANSAEILQKQASVVSGAAELLWSRDEHYARDSFNRTIPILLQEYEAEVRASKPRRSKLNELSAAISALIKSLARRDSRLALSMLKEYQKARTTALADTSSNQTSKEKLEVIREGLDLDTRESASLAAKILKSGIPTSFPQYLYDLGGRDSWAADDLYRLALSLIASGAPYSSAEVNLLSAYAFRERAIILPAIGPSGENTTKVSIGIFTSPLSLLGDKLDLAMAKDYVRVMYPYLSKAGTSGVSEPARTAQNLFLVHKLTVYVVRLKLDDRARWEELHSNFEIMARNNGLDDSNVKYLTGYADRIANDQVAFLFDNGASLFRKANDTSDAKQRTDLLVRGIKELVESKSFEEAERRIGDVDDQSVKRLLSDYLNFKSGEAAARSRDWQEMLGRSGRISNSQLRSLLMLEGARLVKNPGKSRRNRQLVLDLLGRAVDELSKVTNQADKARGLLAAASFMAAIDPDRSLLIANEAIEAINKAKDYDGSNYRAKVIISSVHMDFVLDKSDLESNFEEIAKVDWLGVMTLIDRLESKLLRNKAQLGACRTILG